MHKCKNDSNEFKGTLTFFFITYRIKYMTPKKDHEMLAIYYHFQSNNNNDVFFYTHFYNIYMPTVKKYKTIMHT